jgi:hypothetical protein
MANSADKAASITENAEAKLSRAVYNPTTASLQSDCQPEAQSIDLPAEVVQVEFTLAQESKVQTVQALSQASSSETSVNDVIQSEIKSESKLVQVLAHNPDSYPRVRCPLIIDGEVVEVEGRVTHVQVGWRYGDLTGDTQFSVHDVIPI